MPVLPNYGWLFKCETCNIITSRTTLVKHRRKTRTVYICVHCRHPFIHWLLTDWKTVIIKEDTVAQQIVHVLE